MKISPSILSADFAALGDAVAQAEAGGADMIHVDVMDGRFLPNLTIRPCVIESLRKRTRLPLATHPVIVQPQRYIKAPVPPAANLLPVPDAACPHLQRTLQQIKEAGAKAGVAPNPSTPPDSIEWVLDSLDLILVMSVNPGFGGQSFIPSSLAKLRQIRTLVGSRRIEISVDGGVAHDKAALLAKAGATTLVAGSAVFGTD